MFSTIPILQNPLVGDQLRMRQPARIAFSDYLIFERYASDPFARYFHLNMSLRSVDAEAQTRWNVRHIVHVSPLISVATQAWQQAPR